MGKFGWKGQFATIDEFVANACAMELGLTNPLAAQPVPKQFVRDDAAELDMSRKQLFQLVHLSKICRRRNKLSPAIPRLPPAYMQAKRSSARSGALIGHVPNIGGLEGVYSDFHLYEVEDDEVADSYVEPDFSPEFTLPFHHPRPSEWKTPPLWGVADSAPYFHDGNSPTLTAAILRHGRDGRHARDNFKGLPQQDKVALIAFLRSLRAPNPSEL